MSSAPLIRRIAPIAVLIALLMSPEADAIGRIVIDAGEVAVQNARASDASVVLDLQRAAPALRLSVQQVAAPGGAHFRDVRLNCETLIAREPLFACRDARLTAKGGPTGSLDMRVAAEYETSHGSLRWNASGQQVAGGRISARGGVNRQSWSVDADASALELSELRKLASPWIEVPAEFSFAGRVTTRVRASGRRNALQARIEGSLADANFTNAASTIVGEHVAVAWTGTVNRTPRGLSFDLELNGNAGQALGGPVFYDFALHPIKVTAAGELDSKQLAIRSLAISQKDLMQARMNATVALGETMQISKGSVEVEQLLFPGAYTSFLQLTLAPTPFGALRMEGTARGRIEIEGNRITRVDAQLDKLDIQDDKGKFSMADVIGTVHWSADPDATPAPSQVSWSSGSAYGLSGGAASITFTARADGFELAPGARLPVFDGAVVLNSFSVRGLGSGEPELDLDARIEPISMPLLSRAFGWPELSGQLSGEIPGVTYRNRELIVQGDLVASVFDGTITGRGLRLRDPLGPWPRLYADVTARRLDLALVTSTFSFGSITGRLDADILALELFKWSPVAFDARLYSTPGDRSARYINQKAITRISSIGGGWSGVPAALQSGVLRFFDNFRYDRIGLTCRLSNEVCLMGGIEPVGAGYYIVKGRGLPRIDIIGNAGRVDWPDLVARIVAGMQSQGEIKVE